MIAFDLLIFAIIAPSTIVTAFFAVEVFAGLASSRKDETVGPSPHVAIVIPAHDEAAVIARTLAELPPSESLARVVVVADNCVDDTAAIAGSAGAQVVVRTDVERRGKGFALAAAREFLRADPPDVVVILDADCRIDRASLEALSSVAFSSRRACQAINLLAPDLAAPPMVQISLRFLDQKFD